MNPFKTFSEEITPEHVSLGLQHGDVSMRAAAAAEHPAATPAHIDRALGDSNSGVRAAAAENAIKLSKGLKPGRATTTCASRKKILRAGARRDKIHTLEAP